MPEVKALNKLRICSGSSEPFLLTNVISNKISCADLYCKFGNFRKGLFSWNFTYAKFCENKILTKWLNHSVIYWCQQIIPWSQTLNVQIHLSLLFLKIKFLRKFLNLQKLFSAQYLFIQCEPRKCFFYMYPQAWMFSSLTFCKLANFLWFCCRLMTFFKTNYFKKFFQEHYIRVSNSLNPAQDQPGSKLFA